jgi:hypothetical protein
MIAGALIARENSLGWAGERQAEAPFRYSQRTCGRSGCRQRNNIRMAAEVKAARGDESTKVEPGQPG